MREEDVPSRYDIEQMMETIPVGKKNTKRDRKARNKKRHDKIKESLDPEVFDKISGDFSSYPQWEDEESEEDGQT